MRNFKNILTMVVGSLSILFYTQIGSATASNGTATASAGITDRAASVTDGADHSAKARIFLYCDAGTIAGVQNCQIYAQVLGGAKGVISDENDSIIKLTATGNISASVYGQTVNVQTGTGVSATDSVTAAFVALTGTTPDSDLTVINGTDISTETGDSNQQDNSATGLDGVAPTGDLCRAFSSELKPDIFHLANTYTAAGSDTIADKLALSTSNAALFLLQGFMGDSFLRSTAGYAETFTVPYTITVESNLAGADASC